MAISGASGLIGSALVGIVARRRASGAATRPRRRHRRRRDRVGSRCRSHRRARARRDRRGRAPRGRGDRRAPVDRRAEATHPRQPRAQAPRCSRARSRAASASPACFVSGSAIGYYGNRGDEILTEDSAPGDDFLAGVCVAWEAETAARGRRRSPHRVIIRTGIVLDAARRRARSACSCRSSSASAASRVRASSG